MMGKKLSAELDEEGFTSVVLHPGKRQSLDENESRNLTVPQSFMHNLAGYVKTEMNNGEDGPATLGVEESVQKTYASVAVTV